MRVYTARHRYSCGIDLHARTMYLCVLDEHNEVVLHVNRPSTPEAFLRAIAPYRDDLVVGAECTLSWYWLADCCRANDVRFLLGHALYMRAIHGAKAKSDKIDSLKIARLIAGGHFPMAYVYPSEMRSTRDLLRRRLHFVRMRGQLLAHIQNVHHQYNRAAPGRKIYYAANREGITDGFGDPGAAHSVELDVRLIDHYDALITELERDLIRRARLDDPQAFARVKTIPGVGDILAMTILYEVHDVARFERVQQFLSYSRLVKCQRESAGKVSGTSGSKIGNVHLKWAFSEAAVHFLSRSDDAPRLVARLERQHGKPKALSILAARLGRAVYFMLARKQAFDATRFRATAWTLGGERVSHMLNWSHKGSSTSGSPSGQPTSCLSPSSPGAFVDDRVKTHGGDLRTKTRQPHAHFR